MWQPFPRPGIARAPDGPDSPVSGAAGLAAADARSGRASRRLESLAGEAFAAWLDSRPRGRSTGALVVLRLREAGAASLDALAEASVRAVRPGDRVGRVGAAAIAIWLDGLPTPLAEPRAERLRLSLQRQGFRDLDLIALPVAANDARDAAALLTAAAERIGSLGHALS
jgi:hypothetical protein